MVEKVTPGEEYDLDMGKLDPKSRDFFYDAFSHEANKSLKGKSLNDLIKTVLPREQEEIISKIKELPRDKRAFLTDAIRYWQKEGDIDNIIEFLEGYLNIEIYSPEEREEMKKYSSDVEESVNAQITETLRLAGVQLNESAISNLDDAAKFVSTELVNKFGNAVPATEEEKSYADELINMATIKYNVPEDSLKNKLGIVEEPKIEEEEEAVPGEKIEEV